MITGELPAEQLDGTRDWPLKLLADFSGDDWAFQPGAGLAIRCGCAGTWRSRSTC